MRANISLEKGVFNLLFDNHPSVATIFQIKYYSFREIEENNPQKYSALKTNINIENLINYLNSENIDVNICQDTQKILEAIYILVGNNTLLLTYDFEHGKRNAKHTKNLNNALIKKSVDATYVKYLVSPLTGSGIPVGRIEQIFLHLHMQKVEKENELALGVQKILEQRGQTLTLEGAAIPHGAELKAALLVQAKKFKSELIPFYKSLMLT